MTSGILDFSNYQVVELSQIIKISVPLRLKTDRIMLMKEKLEKLTPNKSAKLGALVFDEVKIQEGLVFDPATWELIGFTDIGEDEHNTTVTSACKPEENIVTHVLMYYSFSLKVCFQISNFLVLIS